MLKDSGRRDGAQGLAQGVIGANISYANEMEELHRRTVRLVEHGVRMIMLQGAGFLFQVAVGSFMKNLRHEVTARLAGF